LIVESTFAASAVSWAFDQVAKSVVGGTGKDACKALATTVWRELSGGKEDCNRDEIARAVRSAQLDALEDVIGGYHALHSGSWSPADSGPSSAFSNAAITFCRNQNGLLANPSEAVIYSSKGTLVSTIEGILSDSTEYAQAGKRAEALRYFAEEAVLAELSDALAPAAIPADFPRHFRTEAGGVGFMGLFASRFTRLIETKPRVRDAISVSLLANLSAEGFETGETLHKLNSRFAHLEKQADDIRRILQDVLGGITQQLHLSNAERLALASQLAQIKERLDGTNILVSGFLTTMLGRAVPPDRFAPTLMTMVSDLVAFDAQILSALRAKDQSNEISTLITLAQEARAAGELDRLSGILGEITALRRSAREKIEALAHESLRVTRIDEADALSTEAALLKARLEYERSADLYIQAADTVRGYDSALEWKCRYAAAIAFLTRGDYFGDRAALSAAVSMLRDEVIPAAAGDNRDVDRAGAVNDIGMALWKSGENRSDPADLEEALRCFDDALKAYDRALHPREWSMAQNNRGIVLWRLSEYSNRASRLAEAEKAIRLALEVRQQETMPDEWAGSQSNLGIVLHRQSLVTTGTELLEQAVHAYKAALEIYSPTHLPFEWAQVESNLGSALSAIAGRRLPSDAAGMRKAIESFRAALTFRQRPRLPMAWAQTRNNLGSTLLALGRLTNDKVALWDAVDCLQDALLEFDERVPREQAQTKMNLGSTFASLAELTRDQKLWKSAIDATESVLLVSTKERFPIEWAQVKFHLGHIYFAMAEQTGNRDFAAKAVSEYDLAFPVFTQYNITQFAENCRYNRDRAAGILSKERRQAEKH
jgi:tetratricopeptide (TPR) repeat protein